MPKTKTIAELRQQLVAKEKQLKALTARRKKITTQLSAVDREIALLGGNAAPAKKAKKKTMRKRRKRTRNKENLAGVLEAVLKGKKGVKVSEAVRLVRATGYKSTAKLFGNIVSQALTSNKRFKKISRGVYALKGVKQTAAKKKVKKAAKKAVAKKKAKKAVKKTAAKTE